jgi:hypothetical protein
MENESVVAALLQKWGGELELVDVDAEGAQGKEEERLWLPPHNPGLRTWLVPDEARHQNENDANPQVEEEEGGGYGGGKEEDSTGLKRLVWFSTYEQSQQDQCPAPSASNRTKKKEEEAKPPATNSKQARNKRAGARQGYWCDEQQERNRWARRRRWFRRTMFPPALDSDVSRQLPRCMRFYPHLSAEGTNTDAGTGTGGFFVAVIEKKTTGWTKKEKEEDEDEEEAATRRAKSRTRKAASETATDEEASRTKSKKRKSSPAQELGGQPPPPPSPLAASTHLHRYSRLSPHAVRELVQHLGLSQSFMATATSTATSSSSASSSIGDRLFVRCSVGGAGAQAQAQARASSGHRPGGGFGVVVLVSDHVAAVFTKTTKTAGLLDPVFAGLPLLERERERGWTRAAGGGPGGRQGRHVGAGAAGPANGGGTQLSEWRFRQEGLSTLLPYLTPLAASSSSAAAATGAGGAGAGAGRTGSSHRVLPMRRGDLIMLLRGLIDQHKLHPQHSKNTRRVPWKYVVLPSCNDGGEDGTAQLRQQQQQQQQQASPAFASHTVAPAFDLRLSQGALQAALKLKPGPAVLILAPHLGSDVVLAIAAYRYW